MFLKRSDVALPLAGVEMTDFLEEGLLIGRLDGRLMEAFYGLC